jgi:Tfp pilus assembly protein PilO
MMSRINPLVAIALSSIAVLLVVIVGWFMFVSPQRSKADKLDTQQASVDSQLAADQRLVAAPHRKATQAQLAAAKLALPDTPEVSAILRQLATFAKESRTQLDTITPAALAPSGSTQSLPITLTFEGRYFGLKQLMKLLQQSARVQKNKLVATGRLYTVSSIQFAQGQAQNSTITATIGLNAFVYGAAPVPAPTDTTTTSTETTATSAG